MIRKVLLLGIITIMTFSLGACRNKYNAVMYSDTGEWINEDFLKENLTRGSHYLDDDQIMVADETYPEFVTFIIMTQEEFDSKFTEFPPRINFEEEMLLVYIFTTTNSGAYKISKISLDHQILNIDFRVEKSKSVSDNLTSPMQKCLIVKVNKMEIIGANFAKVQ